MCYRAMCGRFTARMTYRPWRLFRQFFNSYLRTGRPLMCELPQCSLRTAPPGISCGPTAVCAITGATPDEAKRRIAEAALNRVGREITNF
jgi:hypothetical protein